MLFFKKSLCVLAALAVLALACPTLAQEDGGWTCGQCGRRNKADYRFCPDCGSAAACPGCGYAFAAGEAGFAYCPACGAYRNGESTRPTPAPSPALSPLAHDPLGACELVARYFEQTLGTDRRLPVDASEFKDVFGHYVTFQQAPEKFGLYVAFQQTKDQVSVYGRNPDGTVAAWRWDGVDDAWMDDHVARLTIEYDFLASFVPETMSFAIYADDSEYETGRLSVDSPKSAAYYLEDGMGDGYEGTPLADLYARK